MTAGNCAGWASSWAVGEVGGALNQRAQICGEVGWGGISRGSGVDGIGVTGGT